MSDPEVTPAPTIEQDSTPPSSPPPPPPMEAPPQPPPQPQPQPQPQPTTTTTTTKLDKPGGTSFSIWPPTQRTRDAVIHRLIETLSAPSVLSKRYGTMSPDDASAFARQIEDDAFSAAGASAAAAQDDGIEILQVYSKEISKRMLDTVKARAPAGSAVDNGAAQTPTSDAPPSPSPAADGVPAAAESDS